VGLKWYQSIGLAFKFTPRVLSKPTYSASYSITDFLNLFIFLWVIVALLDQDPDSESASGSTDLNEFGSNPDPDPKHWLKVEFTQRREILI
jgi:hypothetical protein